MIYKPVALSLSLLVGGVMCGASSARADDVVPTRSFSVGTFSLAIRTDTQTLERLSPMTEPAFSFVPTWLEAQRSGNGFNHLGDLHLRVRVGRDGPWRDFTSANTRGAIRVLPAGGSVLAAADITASMGSSPPFRVERRWVNEDGVLALRFTIVNTSGAPMEIGVLGMPMVFDNVITDRDLQTAHQHASFTDPYIGRDAGYLQVTRLNGAGPALLVLPEPGTSLEAYTPIKNPGEDPGSIFTDKTPRQQTFEGFYDWTMLSKGYMHKEWASAGEEWNTPTSRVLRPGQSLQVGVRLVASPSIRAIEKTLVAAHRPVVVSIPGYVLPTDQGASLFVKSPSAVASMESYPAGSLQVTPSGYTKGWFRYYVRGQGWGPARLTITYTDGEKQTVSYFVSKPLDQVMSDVGNFILTKHWFEGAGDPFGRSPAILTYDKEAKKIVDSEPRVWIAGMSDEGGSGSMVAAMMKQLDNPDPAQVSKLDQVVTKTIVGNLQVASGPHEGAVKKSLFYYAPDKFPSFYPGDASMWSSWTSWNQSVAADFGRAYNYPHVAIAHWVLYRVARNHPGMGLSHPWNWYLEHAYITAAAMMRDAPYYTRFGLMEGDVFVEILKDLQREGMASEARNMEGFMKLRADGWSKEAYPFGSEMAWDSTGQPEVYAWMRYFGNQAQADVTREAILGYDPTIPSWGYNGNARRYWDFLYAGKTQRIERMIHHYGSALNAVPLFSAFRQNPSDLHLLRVAYGGMMGPITDIDQNGATSTGFHAWPDMMKWDAYSGDFGMGFFGHAYATGTYVVKDPTFGWLGFGGDVDAVSDTVTIAPRGGARMHLSSDAVRIVPNDGARTRLFIAPAGIWITLEAGKIAYAFYDTATGTVRLMLDPSTAYTPNARIFIEATTPSARRLVLAGGRMERGGYTVPLGRSWKTVTLTPTL